MRFHVLFGQLDQFASKFWNEVNDNRVFAFHGEMGAGKTTIINALCRQKGVTETMGSPTFSIINEYSFVENGLSEPIYHIDLFRLNTLEDVVRAGVEDTIYSNSFCMVEWPEKAPELFDNNTVHVYIRPVSETERSVEVMLPHMHGNSFKEQS